MAKSIINEEINKLSNKGKIMLYGIESKKISQDDILKELFDLVDTGERFDVETILKERGLFDADKHIRF